MAAVGLGVFWKIKGLEEAGWLAGVLSAFVALVSLAILLNDCSTGSTSRGVPVAELGQPL